MSNKKTVAVVGAGIVGTSCALWLQKKGFPVILIDPEKPGSGTSSGNACTIADYGCIPVNSPRIFKRLPSLLFSKNSPLTIDLRVARIIRILGKLLQKTYQGLDPLIEFSNSQHLLSQQGCLQVYKTEQEFENARASNQARRDQGVEFTEIRKRPAIQQSKPCSQSTVPDDELFRMFSVQWGALCETTCASG